MSLTNASRSYPLRAPIAGTGDQCLTYYYHMTNNTISKAITVVKVETNGDNEQLDRVTQSPINGWTARSISYVAKTSNYQVWMFDR